MNTSPNGVVCFYHGNCFDGICAAWVVSLKYPDAEFIPVNYGDMGLMQSIQQDCFENANINTHYVVVDFSFPRDLMIQMANKAKSMIVLDHHQTNQKDCEGLDFCKFDMAESGASLAWKHFFPTEPMPKIVQYVADQDLWKFELPYSREINAYIQLFDMILENYNYLWKILDSPMGLEIAVIGGQAIKQYKDTLVKRIVKSHRILDILGHRVAVVNSPVLMSEVGEALARLPGVIFGAYYFQRSDGMVQWGARSIGDFDVSIVAKKFGGGGHKNAAGWQVEGKNP